MIWFAQDGGVGGVLILPWLAGRTAGRQQFERVGEENISGGGPVGDIRVLAGTLYYQHSFGPGHSFSPPSQLI
jgi:hypothetical protein